jgi:hypothetical protein
LNLIVQGSLPASVTAAGMSVTGMPAPVTAAAVAVTGILAMWSLGKVAPQGDARRIVEEARETLAMARSEIAVIRAVRDEARFLTDSLAHSVDDRRAGRNDEP